MTPREQRAARGYQAKHRGTATSLKTELENTLLMLAWEAEVLSEGQLAKILGMDRIAVRDLRMEMLNKAEALADSLRPARAAASIGAAGGGGEHA